MSVVNSHHMTGAEVILTDHSVLDPAFWDLFRVSGATSLAAVMQADSLARRKAGEHIPLGQAA